MSCDHVEPGVTPLRANVEFVDGTPMGVLISIEVYIANSICFFACVFFTARDCVQTSILYVRVRVCVRVCACACVFCACVQRELGFCIQYSRCIACFTCRPAAH